MSGERADVGAIPAEDNSFLDASDDALSRTLAALAEIDERQAGMPTCVLCGQRTAKPDKWGLCSKITDDHHRARFA